MSYMARGVDLTFAWFVEEACPKEPKKGMLMGILFSTLIAYADKEGLSLLWLRQRLLMHGRSHGVNSAIHIH